MHTIFFLKGGINFSKFPHGIYKFHEQDFFPGGDSWGKSKIMLCIKNPDYCSVILCENYEGNNFLYALPPRLLSFLGYTEISIKCNIKQLYFDYKTMNVLVDSHTTYNSELTFTYID